MLKPIVVIGIGEMAGVFARGFLRAGHPVYPITRDMNMQAAADTIPEPEFVLVAVGETDLQATLQQIPSQWHDKLALLQNELLPRDWQDYPFTNPTIISVWFEKKKGQDAKVLLASPAFGPHAETLKQGLASLDIPCRVVDSATEMQYELLRKNVYIITTNIAGLKAGGTVSELWSEHEALTRAVASDVMDIQATLVGDMLPRERLIDGMLAAFEGDPQHKCMGRSAPARLQRALQLADQAGLDVASLRKIADAQR
ncbi:MAG TPA: hypothetical protein ENJ65_02725 [Candidatus Tenderia electrophaga]|uniref:Ketopantoate reductase N-terminal domain-containing protein n=1 Tax=Candidatus Tenderia electrophaga TaxID=1748243 RepID=A0A832N3M2_9GAMM|nr:hypothetical protein [Candidatus Tenderia electrophaga]